MFKLTPWRKRQERRPSRFRNEVETFFDRFFDEFALNDPQDMWSGTFTPVIDMSEKQDTIIVKAELPGVDKKDINIYIDGRRLSITGEKKQEKEDKDECFHCVETSYGAFRRVIELPVDVNETDVEAIYDKGVLKIVLKKAKEAEVKKIKIKNE